MKLGECVRVAFSALVSNKLRSALTMLGIIIGIAAVIALVSLGEGSQRAVADRMTALGTNLITVSVRAARIDAADAESIFRRAQGVINMSPMLNQSVTAKAGTVTYDTSLTGVSEQYPVIRDYVMEQGRFFDGQEIGTRRYVAVLGATAQDNLFGTRRSINQSINLKGQVFTVIGVLAPKGTGGGQDPDDVILIPYTVAQRMLGTRYVPTLLFKAESSEAATMASDHITRLLEDMTRDTGRYSKGDQPSTSFRVFNQSELLDTMSSVTQTFTTMLAGIAAISLAVGGIGIMNIMLVSVTERTREIGIRKAIGARRVDIMSQFIVESIVMSMTGGIVGILVGFVAANVIGRLNDITAPVSPSAAGLAFGFSALVGLFFGIYPAYRAARLDPIVALRYE